MKNASVEAQIDSFPAKYSPAIAGELRAARLQLRSLFPLGHELVYDNYNALVFGFAPTDRTFLGVAGELGGRRGRCLTDTDFTVR